MKLIVAATLLALTPAPGAAQTSDQSYRAPQSWTFISDNPFRLYLLRDGDTIGPSARGISLVDETWARAGDDMMVVRSSSDLGLSWRDDTDSLRVTPRGRVLEIDGETESDGDWDALLRLPPGGLTVGATWSDTLSEPSSGPAGKGLYRMVRDYRVTGRVDTAGHSAFRVEAEGHLTFRLSMWTDSAAGAYRWFDLAGPATEVYYFDPERGRLAVRRWDMRLEGVGGDFDGERSDTVRAGLRSANRRYPVAPALADLLRRETPKADSSITLRGGAVAVLLHTAGHGPRRRTESLRRADGVMGTATAEFDGAVPARAEVLWTDLEGVVLDARYAREPDGLRALHADSVIPLPADAPWAVADYGMDALLVPALLALEPEAGPHTLHVLRPFTERWDTLAVQVGDRAGVRVAMLRDDRGGAAVLLLDEGSLLYSERREDGTMVQRVPSAGRQQRFQEVLERLQGGGG